MADQLMTDHWQFQQYLVISHSLGQTTKNWRKPVFCFILVFEMAKIINPLMSFSATGSIAKRLTFSNTKKSQVVKNYMRYSAKRKSAPSQRQIQIQENFRNADIFYSGATTEEKENIYSPALKNKSIERNAVMGPIMKKRPTYIGLFFIGDNTFGNV